MGMRGIYTSVNDIRKMVFAEIARLSYNYKEGARIKQGEVISIMDENNVEFARGMANYSSAECRRIVGSHSNDIENILGYKNYDAVVTRDNITELV